MRTEHDVREAFTAIADRAPTPDRSRVAIPRDMSGGRIRRRTLVACVAVATATAAVAAPAAISVFRADAPIEPATGPTPPVLGKDLGKDVGKESGGIITPPTADRPPGGQTPRHTTKVKVPTSVIGTHRPATATATTGDLFHVDLPAGWKKVSSSRTAVAQSQEFTAPGGHRCLAKVYVRGGFDPAELPSYAAPAPVNGKPGYWVDALLFAGVVDGAIVWRYAPDSWAVTSCGALGAPSDNDPYGRDRTLEQTLAEAVVIHTH
jgi:hypothetical protein